MVLTGKLMTLGVEKGSNTSKLEEISEETLQHRASLEKLGLLLRY